MPPPTPDSPDSQLVKAKSDALRLLSFRPRSVEELRRRLKLKKYPEELVERVLEFLKKQRLLDDESFARLFAHSRVFSRPVGKRQLEFELKRKGLSKELVSKAMEGLSDYDERAAARELVYRRFQKMKGVPREKKKARLFAFLKRRGFETNAIFDVISGLFHEETDEIDN